MSFPQHLRDHWYVACLSSELKGRPLARSVLGTDLALFRSEGTAQALLDRCAHRNAPLSQGRVGNGRLACPYHGWEFDGCGECRLIPGRQAPRGSGAEQASGEPEEARQQMEAGRGKRRVAAFAVCEEKPFVWVCPRPGSKPDSPPPRGHQLESIPGARLVRSFALEASLLDGLENFLDPTHTHFVHSGLVRSPSARKLTHVTIRGASQQAEAEYHDEGQQSGLIARWFGGGVSHTAGRFLLPATVQLDYFGKVGILARISLYFTPRTEVRQEVFASLVARAPRGLRRLMRWPAGWLLGRVVRQDQKILALQRANLERFGGCEFATTELDLLRPHIARLLEFGPLSEQAAFEKQTTMLL